MNMSPTSQRCWYLPDASRHSVKSQRCGIAPGRRVVIPIRLMPMGGSPLSGTMPITPQRMRSESDWTNYVH